MKADQDRRRRGASQSARQSASRVSVFAQRNRAILEGERATQAALPLIRARLAALRDARLAQARQAAEAETARQREAERKTRCAAQQGWLDVLRRDPDCRGG